MHSVKQSAVRFYLPNWAVTIGDFKEYSDDSQVAKNMEVNWCLCLIILITVCKRSLIASFMPGV